MKSYTGHFLKRKPDHSAVSIEFRGVDFKPYLNWQAILPNIYRQGGGGGFVDFRFLKFCLILREFVGKS